MDIVHAMARCPVPDEVQRTGRQILRAIKEPTEPDIVAQMQIRSESIDWTKLAANTCIKPVALIFTDPDKRLVPIAYPVAPATIRQMVGAAA